jgi:hypothetical protein
MAAIWVHGLRVLRADTALAAAKSPEDIRTSAFHYKRPCLINHLREQTIDE